jgi:hypothetical protein
MFGDAGGDIGEIDQQITPSRLAGITWECPSP